MIEEKLLNEREDRILNGGKKKDIVIMSKYRIIDGKNVEEVVTN